MGLLGPSMQYAAGGTVVMLVLAFLLFQPNGFVRWLQKKNYQYEVTFALYMLTPTEKFIFNSVLFLTIAMLTTACALYLPNHVLVISKRAYYYFAGDAAILEASRTAASQIGGRASKASEAVIDAATNLAEAAFRAGVNTAAAAQEAVLDAAENWRWE